ncbi:MAG: DUF3187 family protein [Deltaproteobacteria bacterium]|nr:DUF3187 family protein [Deltaproteobacteria bacterium]
MLRLVLILLLFLSPSVYARDYAGQGPLITRTQHPVYLQMVNLNPDRAMALPTGLLEVRVDSAYSNIFERQADKTYFVDLDMELWRIGWVGTYGLGKGFDVGMEVPLLHMNGGYLDGFIQDYHNAFGFPNGGRDQVPNGIFEYFVRENGRTRYQVGSQDLNIGDITLFMKHQLLHETDVLPALSWRFGFKFPSGDPDKGMGSGNPGFGFGVAAEKSYKKLHGYLNANYLVDGGNEAIENLMETGSFVFTVAGEWSFSDRISLLLQLDGGTPRLKGTGLEEWDGVPMDFIVGVKGDAFWGKTANPFFWEFGFAEDILAEGPSVDFTIYITIGVRFFPGKVELYKGNMWGKL